jgi:hypothetical protein
MVALRNASILFSTNHEEIKLYRSLKNDKEADVCDKFEISDLSIENLEAPVTFILKSEQSLEKYQETLSKFSNVKLIYVDKVKDETCRDIIFDAIKVKLLQDETDQRNVSKVHAAECAGT